MEQSKGNMKYLKPGVLYLSKNYSKEDIPRIRKFMGLDDEDE